MCPYLDTYGYIWSYVSIVGFAMGIFGRILFDERVPVYLLQDLNQTFKRGPAVSVHAVRVHIVAIIVPVDFQMAEGVFAGQEYSVGHNFLMVLDRDNLKVAK